MPMSQPSQYHPTISLTQALTLLIKHYKNDEKIKTDLKHLYLNGAASDAAFNKIKFYLKDPILAGVKIEGSHQQTNNDATRRYFETHLAYHTLSETIKNISIESLYQYKETLQDLFPISELKSLMYFLNGKINFDDDDNMAKEYHDAIVKLSCNKYPHFAVCDQEKILLIVQCAFLCLNVVTTTDIDLPLDIYQQGYYLPAKRGRLEKNGNDIKPLHFGLLKNWMPVPRNDLAYNEDGICFNKPSEKFDYDIEAAWPINNFNRLVHPFSCSISGTVLSQLKVLKFLSDRNQLEFNDVQLINLLKCTISFLLYHSGGHSLFEFHYPIKLPDVQDAFRHIKGFDELSLSTMFLSDNQSAFNKAMHETIAYNDVLIQKFSHLNEIDAYHSKIEKLKLLLPQMYICDDNEELKPSINRHNQLLDQLKQKLGTYVKPEKVIHEVARSLNSLEREDNDFFASNSYFSLFRTNTSLLQQKIQILRSILMTYQAPDVISKKNRWPV